MVSVIRHEVLERGQKALAYNGFGHTTLAVTRDPREETGLRFSAAYQLRQRFGNRITYADYPAEGIVQLSFKPEVVTTASGFITPARVEEAKRKGYLPNVPEIAAEWILNHQKQFTMIH